MFEVIEIELPSSSLPVIGPNTPIQDPYYFKNNIVYRRGDGRIFRVKTESPLPENFIGRVVIKEMNHLDVNDVEALYMSPLTKIDSKTFEFQITPEQSIKFPLRRSIQTLALAIGIGDYDSKLSEEYNFKLTLIPNVIQSLF